MLTFYSASLLKDIPYDSLGDLDKTQLEAFHRELLNAVQALDRVLTDAKARERVSGIACDPHWLHRVQTKKRIALKFATEVNSRLNGGSTVEQRSEYERIYKAVFRKFMVDEFGEEELAVIEQELLTDARAKYAKWIAETNQRMWFIP